MNRMFLTVYGATLIAILVAVSASGAIVWMQWQPDYNYQLKRFSPDTAHQIKHAFLEHLEASQCVNSSINCVEEVTIEFRDQKLTYNPYEVDSLKRVSRRFGGLLAIIHINDLQLAPTQLTKLNEGQVISNRSGTIRRSYLKLDETRALEVELMTLRFNGNQWLAELIFLLEERTVGLRERLNELKPLLYADEVPKFTPLRESGLSRLEVSRLLYAPRSELSLTHEYTLTLLEIPPQGEESYRSQTPQVVELPVSLSVALLPPVVVLPLIVLFVGFAIWLKINPIARKACRLAQVTQSFGDGDLNARVQLAGDGPVERIASIFDQAADRVVSLIYAQETLLRSVSHELKTPIFRLYLLVDQLQESVNDDSSTGRSDERAILFSQVENNLQELSSLTEELLKYKQYRQRELNFSRDPCNASKFFQGLIYRSVDLSTEVELQDETEGQLIIFGACNVLSRAFNNLLQNADRYAQEKIRISVRRIPTLSGEEGERCLVSVEDDGCGIAISDRERIFDPFMRLDESRSRISGGVGLGLSIAQAVIHAFDGEITAHASEDLGGACFRVILPAQDASTLNQPVQPTLCEDERDLA